MRLHVTEQKAVGHNVVQQKTGKGVALQQGSSSSAPQAAAGSLAADGKNRGKFPDVHQRPAGQDGKSAGRQQKKSFSMRSLFGFKKSATTSAQPATTSTAEPEASRVRRPTLADYLAKPQDDDPEVDYRAETVASSADAHLTRSDDVKRHSLEDMNGRPMVKEGYADSVPMQFRQQQLQNFSQMRQNMLSRISKPPSAIDSQEQGNDIAGRHHEIEELPPTHADSLPMQFRQQQLQNFSQMRQNMLSRISKPPSAIDSQEQGNDIAGRHHEIEELPPTQLGSPERAHVLDEIHGNKPGQHQQMETQQPAASYPSGTSEISGEDDNSEMPQLYQQTVERKRIKPTQPLMASEPAPVTRKFQPTIPPIAESLLETESSIELSSLQKLSKLSNRPFVPLEMSVDNGKLQLPSSNPAAINMLLSQTLGKENQHYLAHAASSDGLQHLLLDKQGRLFIINSHDSGYSVLHNSRSAAIRTKLTQSGDAPISLECSNGKIHISIGTDGQNKLSINQPGDIHRSVLSGVWQHPPGATQQQGDLICLHNNKIHILNPETGVWQTSCEDSHAQLSRQADGKLYAVQESHTLHNLSDDNASEKFVDKIKSFAVSEHVEVAILTDTESPHHICLMPSSNAPPEDTLEMLKSDRTHLEAQFIGISKGKLYAADSEGKLYRGVLSQVRNDELPMKSISKQMLKEHFGDDHRIEGFFTDSHGQLNALVKDNFRQQHACPLGDDHQFHAGWNLSDTLVINSHLGLQNINPEPHEILNMGRESRLTLQEGKVHYFDQLTKGWTASELGCEQLKKGLDGAAYILKDGEVKRLYINQSTSSISQGKDNFFTLSHVRNKPESGSALQGLDKSDKAQAMAVIGVNKYLALSEKGDIRSFQIKPGTKQLARSAQTLSLEGISGVLKDIHVDHQQNLYAVNLYGEIFHQPRDQWQSCEADGSWQKLAMPHSDSELQRLEMDHENRPVATMVDGSQHQLREGWWHAHVAPEPVPLDECPRAAEQIFKRLIPGTSMTVQATAQVIGQTGMENCKISTKFTDRVRAYIFNPTMATPRPIKNAAYNMQHNWQGRRGLNSVYEMQGALIKQLESQNVLNSSLQVDLHSKMEALDLGEHGVTLLNDMKRFREELEMSAVRYVTALGQHHMVLKSNGQINEKFKPSATKSLVQSFNVNRSGRDLSVALEKAISSAAPSPQSKLQTLLTHFVRAGVNMSHQKGDVPLGRQRDPNDQTSLTKSRLILDTVIIGELHKLVDKAALLSGEQPQPGQIQRLRQQFDTLRDKQYGANPVKQFTDMGFTHTAPLEANYDAVKALINAFSKKHHGVNLTTRSVLQTEGKSELEKKLKETLLSLDGGESISFSLAYGGGLSTEFLLKEIPVPIFSGAELTLDRAYYLSFGRTTDGLDVSFGRDGGVTGTISVFSGYNLVPYMAGKKTTAEDAIDWLRKKHKIRSYFHIGGSISSNIQGVLQNSLNFKLTEDELPDFLHALTHGTLTPIELMKKGIEHQMKQGTRLVFNVDTSATLALRAGIDVTNVGAKRDRVIFRASTGIRASSNLMTTRRERNTQQGELGSTVSASDNRPTFFNSATLGANATLSVVLAHDFTREGKAVNNGTNEPAKPFGTFLAFPSTNVSVALNMDNRTTQKISVEMKQADPVTSNDINELTTILGKHFKDSLSTKLLANLKKEENPDPTKQLSSLNSHFTRSKVVGDDRYKAIRSLEKLVLRQQAAETNVMGLASAKHTTAYNNLSRLNENGILDLLKQHFNAALPPTNAMRLSAMMDNDPVLKGFIKQLQSTPFTSASVSMELKDSLRDETEKAIIDGKIGRDELGLLFQDRNNLRISSISVNQRVSKSEGFNTPTLLLGGSNSVGVSMVRNTGTIKFEYGQDQDTPRCFTLEGEIAKANPEVASAFSELRKEGFEMKS